MIFYWVSDILLARRVGRDLIEDFDGNQKRLGNEATKKKISTNQVK